MPGSAGARGSVKAARFRPVFPRLRGGSPGCAAPRPPGVLPPPLPYGGRVGQLVTVPLFRPGLETGIEAPLGRAQKRKDKP